MPMVVSMTLTVGQQSHKIGLDHLVFLSHVLYFCLVFRLDYRYHDCLSMHHERGFLMGVWSALLIDNHHAVIIINHSSSSSSSCSVPQMSTFRVTQHVHPTPIHAQVWRYSP